MASQDRAAGARRRRRDRHPEPPGEDERARRRADDRAAARARGARDRHQRALRGADRRGRQGLLGGRRHHRDGRRGSLRRRHAGPQGAVGDGRDAPAAGDGGLRLAARDGKADAGRDQRRRRRRFALDGARLRPPDRRRSRRLHHRLREDRLLGRFRRRLVPDQDRRHRQGARALLPLGPDRRAGGRAPRPGELGGAAREVPRRGAGARRSASPPALPSPTAT